MDTPTKYCFVSISVTRSNMQQASQCLSQGAFSPTKLYVISYRYNKFLTKLAFSMAYSLVPRYEANLCVSTSKHNINIIPSHKIEINCLCMYTAVAIDAVAGCRVLQYFRAKNQVSPAQSSPLQTKCTDSTSPVHQLLQLMQHAKLEFVTLNVILLSKVYQNIIGLPVISLCCTIVTSQSQTSAFQLQVYRCPYLLAA